MSISTNSIIINTTLFVVSIIVWIVLGITQQRTKKGLKTCNGRPGIVFPINFLNPRHRLVYVLACGALASEWFGLLTTKMSLGISKWATPIVHPFVIMYMVSVVIVITYPILACVEAPIPLMGYIIGAIYSDIYFVLIIYLFAEYLKLGANLVSNYKPVYYSNIVVSNVPKFTCLIGILIWYHYKLIKELLRVYKTGNQWKLAIQEQPHSLNHINYVKQLLQPPELVNLTFIKKHILTRTKLPLPVLIVAVVVVIILFQLTVAVCFYFPYLFDQFGNIFEALLEQYPDFKDYTFFSKLPHFFKSLTAISVLSPIFATILCCVLFIHFIYCLRLELRSSKSKLFKTLSNITWPTLTLSSSVRYAGYQIAAFITAWILYTVVIFVIGLALMALIIFIPSIFGYYFYRLIVVVSWVILIVGTQMIICKLFFVSNDSADLKTVIIDNRRAFNMFSYIVLLYNMATGLMTAIIRVGLSFLFMIMILPRMDRLMYMKGFEKCDSSHSIFKNFILIESLLQNPIVHVFLTILSETTSDTVYNEKSISSSDEVNSVLQSITTTYDSKMVSSADRPRVSKKAYNRWFVAYTLIKNPKLAKSYSQSDEEVTIKNLLLLNEESSVQIDKAVPLITIDN